MKLALFDLDNTLLDGDSDHLWGEFMVDKGLVDKALYRKKNDQFYQDYLDGILDMVAYQHFCLAPLQKWSMEELNQLHQEFMSRCILPIIKPKCIPLISAHRQKGDKLLVITATNSFITAPIVKHLGIDELIATKPKISDGRFTGEIDLPPCYQEGKITLLQRWLTQSSVQYELDQCIFYSDSFNDLPLLRAVGHPIVVDGDSHLVSVAKHECWPSISLR